MKNKFLLALIITLALSVAVAVGVVIFSVLNPGEDDESSRFDGTYYLSLDVAGQSSYTFNLDGTGKRKMVYLENADTMELVEKTDDFTYSISGKQGSRKIEFTWSADGKKEIFDFATGTYLGKEAVYIDGDAYCKE